MGTFFYIVVGIYMLLTVVGYIGVKVVTDPYHKMLVEELGILPPTNPEIHCEHKRKIWRDKYSEMVSLLKEGKPIPEDDALMNRIYYTHKINKDVEST